MVRCSRLVIFCLKENLSSVSHASASHVTFEMFISKAFRRPCRKDYRLSLTQIVHSNDKMLLLKQNSYLSKFLWRAAHVYLFWTSRKSSVFRHASARCLFWRPCRKNCISSSIRHKSFIQMVKYSFPDERIVYRSFLNINIISNHNDIRVNMSRSISLFCQVVLCVWDRRTRMW